jgi:hypothetical protein
MHFTFSNGAAAGVSLTYDDGFASHLDVVAPDLEALGLRGTFFAHTQRPPSCVMDRPTEWRALVSRGHEVGNHTQYHPCGMDISGSKPNFSLEAYSLARMESELLAAERDLDFAVGKASRRSFAYPCCQTYVGPEKTSYRPMAARLFAVCRGGGGATHADPFDCDFAFVPAWCAVRATPLEKILAFVDRSIAERKWGVLVFHGIGGDDDWLTVGREMHHSLLQYIARRRDEGALACDTFRNIAATLPGSPVDRAD